MVEPDRAPGIDRRQILWLIDHACRIDRLSFKVLVLLLAILAVLASIVRLQFRVRNDRRLLLDDWLVLFATVCLVTETGLVFHFSNVLYLSDALNTQLAVYLWIWKDEALLNELFGVKLAYMIAYFAFGWVTIFAVKYSFLALFYPMVTKVKTRLRIWYWVTVAATTIAGIFITLDAFVVCPRFGADDNHKCTTESDYHAMLGAGIVVQVLDIVSDLMIISIPLILLRMSQIRFKHKRRIAITLSLSGICIILSVARVSGGIRKNLEGAPIFGVVWISFLLHCEASIAVLAGSVPALRAIYRTHLQRRITYPSEDVESAKTTLKSRPLHSIAMGWPNAAKWPKGREEHPQSPTPHSIYTLPPLCGLSRQSQHAHSNGQSECDLDKDSDNQSMINVRHAHHDSQTSGQNEIRVTYECTVVSEDASSQDMPDFNEATLHANLFLGLPTYPDIPEPVAGSNIRSIDYGIEEHFGRISVGLHV
ncbi:hypothetical protein K505DRAFT_379079 [Melanomma pulvis-pyrius CBS 109.77]|uniref:Rhodopsin domain-containing protein n=1 Tax=Melanomma pulvis-pyrius CBS 109.77 TaxID=1314802 RepID=A0A6A6WVQ4_9PLEO|nr:hypothetical protein K505DRAFT_379079 [Melanomma pulvis-pyrius CBS 109.77]